MVLVHISWKKAPGITADALLCLAKGSDLEVSTDLSILAELPLELFRVPFKMS
jgi:hypothetical protein